jgi:hypothetical protein
VLLVLLILIFANPILDRFFPAVGGESLLLLFNV